MDSREILHSAIWYRPHKWTLNYTSQL